MDDSAKNIMADNSHVVWSTLGYEDTKILKNATNIRLIILGGTFQSETGTS